jgi:endoglucanase
MSRLAKVAVRTADAVRALLVTALVLSFVPGSALASDVLANRDLLTDKRPIIHADGPSFGVYDPYGDFGAQKDVAIEHLFLPWEDVELEGLSVADQYAFERGRSVLLSVEPWSWSPDWNVSPLELRDRILSGRYDGNMRAILERAAEFKSPVIIRWGAEMDNPSGRFSWANWAPSDYIAAYRRMMDIVREMLPVAKIMWSPRGDETLQAYYPGDEYVDIVGLSVFGFEAYDMAAFAHPRRFSDALRQGYELVAGFGKPVWVAEIGYEGSVEYLGRWVHDLTYKDPAFPLLEAVVYYNDKEVWSWPYDLGFPQWRVVRTEGKGLASHQSRAADEARRNR